MRIDCHFLTLPSDTPELRSGCEQALSRQPVNVIHSPGIVGDIRQARADAYSKGTAEFVSYVDPDDEVHPGAFEACLKFIDDRPSLAGCYTQMIKHIGTNVRVRSHPNWNVRTFIENGFNHTFIVRRNIIERVLTEHFDLLPRIWGQDRCILALAGLYGPFAEVPIIGYSYFQRATSTCVKFNHELGPAYFDRNIKATREMIYHLTPSQPRK
jgi:hypothetical protein